MVKFCSNCKKIIPIIEKKCPFCGNQNLLRFCRDCKKILPDGAIICPSCGKKDDTILKNSNTTKHENKKKHKFTPFFGIVILLLSTISVTSLITINIMKNNDVLSESENSNIIEHTEMSKLEVEEKPIVQRDNCDFRNAKWGDSKETVTKYDNTIKIEETTDNMIAGTDSVSGYNVVVGYTFDDNEKLFRGTYIFLYKEKETWKLIAAYNDLKEKFTKTYGQPDQSEVIPLTLQDLIDMSGQETALELGYVMYVSTWTTDTTKITMNLSTESYQTTLGVIYQDLNYEDSLDGI